MLEYRYPTVEDEKILNEYIDEHYKNGEYSISASLEITKKKYEDWLDEIIRNIKVNKLGWGISELLMCFSNKKLIGLLHIRYNLSLKYKKIYGNVGYGVRPSERNKGYATLMLKKALELCKEKNMRNVIIGCYNNNIASKKTILKNNGKLIYELNNDENIISEYYKIELE